MVIVKKLYYNMMQKRFYMVLVGALLILPLSAQRYHVPEEKRYEPATVGATAPSVSASFQSTSTFSSGSYTVPFAASDVSEIGASSPTSGPRKAPPSIDGGEENAPDMPGFDQPIGDGLYILLLLVFGYTILNIRQRILITKK